MRPVVFAASVMLAGCGAAASETRDTSATETRAAIARFVQQCSDTAGSVSVAVLCPKRLPLGDFERPRNYGDAPCTYLINLEPRRMLKRTGAVVHMLFGGTCRPWNLRTRNRRWPASLTPAPAGEDLRLIGNTSLTPGQTQADRKRVRLKVLRRTRIGSAPALVLRNPPYPVGGIHGGHISIVWNADGGGYVVTGHAVASPQRTDAAAGPRALGRATDTLITVARSMR